MHLILLIGYFDEYLIMIIKSYDIQLTEKIKQKPYFLFPYILFKIYAGLLSFNGIRISAIIIFCIIIEEYIFNLTNLMDHRFITIILWSSLYFALIPIIVSLEEFCHAAVCVQIGKLNMIKSLRLRYLETNGGYKLVIASFSINFEGRFSKIDIFKISAGGPVGVLCFLAICILVGVLYDFSELIYFSSFFLLFPISSLIHFRLLLESDGYKIKKISKELGLSILHIAGHIISSLLLICRYFFCMSPSQRYQIALLSSRAMSLIDKNKFKDAEAVLLNILRIDPDDHVACNNLACIYLALNKNIEKAKTLSQIAYKFQPDDPEYNDTLGQVYYKLGDNTKSLEHFNIASAIRPDDIEIQKHLRLFESN